MFRCPQCRTRRKSFDLFTRHVRETRHALCNCGGYHYAHRPGSRLCEQNPMSAYWDASRRGDSEDVLMDILADLYWDGIKGNTGQECPF